MNIKTKTQFLQFQINIAQKEQQQRSKKKTSKHRGQIETQGLDWKDLPCRGAHQTLLHISYWPHGLREGDF